MSTEEERESHITRTSLQGDPEDNAVRGTGGGSVQSQAQPGGRQGMETGQPDTREGPTEERMSVGGNTEGSSDTKKGRPPTGGVTGGTSSTHVAGGGSAK